MSILRKTPLKNIKPGDKLVDMDGRITIVKNLTEETIPDQLFDIELENDTGQVWNVRADANHVWPLDPRAMGYVPPEAEGETEASTAIMAQWTAMGWRPRLAPMNTAHGVIHWTVRTITLLNEQERLNTHVKCVKVDSPTHSFLLANDDDVPAITIPNTTGGATRHGKKGNDGSTPAGPQDMMGTLDPVTFDKIANYGVPTHNCGGPLTLGTMLKTPDGEVSMKDVQVGDTLLGPDGSGTTVTWKSPVMEPLELFNISVTETEVDIPDWTMEDLIQAEKDYQESLDAGW